VYTGSMPYKDPEKQREAWRRYYERRKAAGNPVINTSPACRERNRKIMIEAKSVPCTDCGVRYHQCQMDFDHISDDKEAAVGWMANQPVSVKRLLAEIEKCEVVCANCHRLRTWSRRVEASI
jgi:hypothetical protein